MSNSNGHENVPPTDAIVTAGDLAQARAQVRTDGLAQVMDTLDRTEPELSGFILTASHCVAGRLALFAVNNRLVRDTADDMVETVLTVLMAMRQSHGRLWQSVMPENDVPF